MSQKETRNKSSSDNYDDNQCKDHMIFQWIKNLKEIKAMIAQVYRLILPLLDYIEQVVKSSGCDGGISCLNKYNKNTNNKRKRSNLSFCFCSSLSLQHFLVVLMLPSLYLRNLVRSSNSFVFSFKRRLGLLEQIEWIAAGVLWDDNMYSDIFAWCKCSFLSSYNVTVFVVSMVVMVVVAAVASFHC